MKRRTFLQSGALACAATGTAGLFAPTKALSLESRPDAAKLQRIGCTTTCFRMLFAETRPPNASRPDRDLMLLEIPALFAEKLGIHNVEIWSQHFPEMTAAFAEKLRRAAAQVGSTIINLQLDSGKYNLSNPNKAEREKSLLWVKQWMDLAAASGAPSMRANTGGGPNDKFDLSVTADSFRQLSEYGQKLSVKILVENHGGHSLQPNNVVAIVKAVDSPWCRSLPDFGNIPKGEDEAFREQMLKMLFPLAHLASAKGMWFDEGRQHQPYDVGRCVQIGETCGFKGVYSVEYYDPQGRPFDAFEVANRLIRLVADHLK